MRSRSRQGALGRRRCPPEPLRTPQRRRSRHRAAARPAASTSQAHGGHGPAGAEGPAWAAGTEHSALSGARCRPPPGGDAGGTANSRETFLEAVPRSSGQPGGAATGQSRPLIPHLPPATWPHAPGTASGTGPRRPTPTPWRSPRDGIRPGPTPAPRPTDPWARGPRSRDRGTAAPRRARRFPRKSSPWE